MSIYLPIQKACTPPMVASLVLFGLAAIVSINYLSSVLFILGIIFYFDAGARYREYVILRRRLMDYDNLVTERDIKYFRSSYCRRHSAVAAGISPEVFYKLGYRWYHLLPDDCPRCFFRAGFWRNLFGIKKRN